MRVVKFVAREYSRHAVRRSGRVLDGTQTVRANIGGYPFGALGRGRGHLRQRAKPHRRTLGTTPRHTDSSLAAPTESRSSNTHISRWGRGKTTRMKNR